MLYFPACCAGDGGFATVFLNLIANGFAVIALIAEHLFGIAVDVLHQGRKRGDIVRLPRRDHDADWQAFSISTSVDFGGEAAARTAERVALSSPFPPAAQWCARIIVASTICSVASHRSLPASASRITSHMPLSAQRRNCRKIAFQSPNSSGTSRQGAPVRITQKIASSTRR